VNPFVGRGWNLSLEPSAARRGKDSSWG
jgi:hypothetical protein